MATGRVEPRKLKDGTYHYQAIVELGRDPVTGERMRKQKTVATKKLADATLRKMLNEAETTGLVTPSVMTLGDWMKKWLEIYLPNIEESTRSGYEEKRRNYIHPGLGNIRLNALNADVIQTWVNGLKQSGRSSKTIKNTFNILHAALKKAVILRMIPYNPCDGVELPKLQPYVAHIYSKQDIQAALSAASGTDMYLIVLLLLSAGLRRGELAGLRWENIDFEERILHICENRVNGGGKVVVKAPKTVNGNREILVGSEVMAALRQAKAEYDAQKAAYGIGFQDLGYVIRNKNGRPYHPDSLTKKWLRFVAKNNLTHIRLYDLRHTNATSMIGAGVPTKVVSERLGHADINTTLKYYVHTTPEMNEGAAEKIDDIIFH